MAAAWVSVKNIHRSKPGISLWDRALLWISGQLRIAEIVMGSQLVAKYQEMPGIASPRLCNSKYYMLTVPKGI